MIENRGYGREPADLLDIMNDVADEIDSELDELLERGKTERVMILTGTESPRRGTTPYARTEVEISFDNERDLRECVRLLRWSDERLRARPEQLLLWECQSTFRESMTIHFGVNRYDQDFFERRQEAFREPTHAAYYARFGATPDDFRMSHMVLADYD